MSSRGGRVAQMLQWLKPSNSNVGIAMQMKDCPTCCIALLECKVVGCCMSMAWQGLEAVMHIFSVPFELSVVW